MRRSQQGNNNPYCQDNEVSWFNWDLPDKNAALLDFTRQLVYFRSLHPIFRRRKWFQGRASNGLGVNDISWFTPDGKDMTQKHWECSFAKAISVFLNGEEIGTRGPRGEYMSDDSFLLFFNAHYEMIQFTLPTKLPTWEWIVVIDTNEPRFVTAGNVYKGSSKVSVTAQSMMVLRRVR